MRTARSGASALCGCGGGARLFNGCRPPWMRLAQATRSAQAMEVERVTASARAMDSDQAIVSDRRKGAGPGTGARRKPWRRRKPQNSRKLCNWRNEVCRRGRHWRWRRRKRACAGHGAAEGNRASVSRRKLEGVGSAQAMELARKASAHAAQLRDSSPPAPPRRGPRRRRRRGRRPAAKALALSRKRSQCNRRP